MKLEFTQIVTPKVTIDDIRALWRSVNRDNRKSNCLGFDNAYVGNWTWLFDNGYAVRLDYPYDTPTMWIGLWMKNGEIRYVEDALARCCGTDEDAERILADVDMGNISFWDL